MIAATIIGTALAIGLVRSRTRWAPGANILMLVPLVVPEIVTGISALLIFSQIGIQLSLWTIVIAHITFSISYVTIVVRARMASISQEVEEAAMDLGATRWQSVRLVLVPALWPAVVAAGLLVFAFSFDDFVLSFFTTGEDLQPLPVRIWSAIRFGLDPTINAIGTLMMIVSLSTIGARGGDPATVRPQGERLQGADGRRGMEQSDAWRCAREMSEAIRLESVSKKFGDHVAVDDISLTIEQGEFFSLLGPSGCGKTTTLRMLAGFEVPTEGRIMLEGDPVEKVPPYERDVNMVFQSYALFEHLDIDDNVAFGLRRKKVAKDEIRERVAAALELVNLVAARQRPHQRALGRPEAAGRARARAGQPAEGPAARRAARRPRPEAAPPDAGRAQADPARGRDHLRLRHPRPGGGAGDVGPDRRDDRRPRRPVRRRRRRSTSIPASSSSPASSASRTCSRAPSRRAAGPDRQRHQGAGPAARRLLARATSVNLSVRPEKIAVDEIEEGMVTLEGTIEARVYLGVTTQITVAVGDGAHLVALEQATYRASADDRWDPGMKVRLGWHPEHCLVLR